MPFGTWTLWREGGHTLQLNLRPLKTSGCHIPFPKFLFPRWFLPFLLLSFLFVLFSNSPLLLSSPTCVYLFHSQLLLIFPLFCPSMSLILSPSLFPPSAFPDVSVSRSSLILTLPSGGVPGTLVPFARPGAEQGEPGQRAEQRLHGTESPSETVCP